MMLFTKPIRARLFQNGIDSLTKGSIDHKPVVKLFMPTSGATWLISEIDPQDNDIMFGLCDLGMGEPELGSVRLSEITAIRGRFGLGVERDRGFKATKTLGEYADAARTAGRIVA